MYLRDLLHGTSSPTHGTTSTLTCMAWINFTLTHHPFSNEVAANTATSTQLPQDSCKWLDELCSSLVHSLLFRLLYLHHWIIKFDIKNNRCPFSPSNFTWIRGTREKNCKNYPSGAFNNNDALRLNIQTRGKREEKITCIKCAAEYWEW